MSDKLRMDYINSLPQPLIAVMVGGSWWPVLIIDVETGLMKLDVIGKVENTHIGNVREFIDDAGVSHDPDSFYSDLEQPQ